MLLTIVYIDYFNKANYNKWLANIITQGPSVDGLLN